MDNRQMISKLHGKRLQKVAVWGKLERVSWKPASLGAILIYLEYRDKLPLITNTVLCMDTHSPNKLGQNTVLSYSEMIPVSSFFSFFFVFMLCHVIYFVIISLWKINILIFSCSGMFRDVLACFVFRVLSTPRFGRRYLTKIAILKYLMSTFVI